MTDSVFSRLFSLIGVLFALLLAAVILLKGAAAFAQDEELNSFDDAAVIQVKSIAEIDGGEPEITLGNVMVARGVSRAAMEKLRHVRLADTPRPGESRTFSADGLEMVFRPLLREIEEKTGEKIALRVPARVSVSRKTLKLRREEVEGELRSQLKAICGDCDVEISQLNMPAIPPTLAASASWKLKLRSELPKGSFSAPLEVTNEDSSKRTYWITGLVAFRKAVPVASRQMELGERIRAEDYSMQKRDITFASDLAASETEIGSSVIARQVAAGQVLWRSGLRREMAIKIGDPVKVVAGTEAWQISIEGVSQTQGYIGDLVRVKIPRTQKTVSGMLREKGLVEVQ